MSLRQRRRTDQVAQEGVIQPRQAVLHECVEGAKLGERAFVEQHLT